MSEILSSAIKTDEELDERLNTPIPQHIQSIEIIVFKWNFCEQKNKKSHSHKTSSRLLQVLVISPMNYKTNFMNIKIIRQHVIFSKTGTLSVLVCYARILPTSIQTGFSTITFMCHNILCLCKSGSSALAHIKNKSTKLKESWKEYKNGFIEH